MTTIKVYLDDDSGRWFDGSQTKTFVISDRPLKRVLHETPQGQWILQTNEEHRMVTPAQARAMLEDVANKEVK